MKSYRLTEVKSYNVPFVRLPRPVFWFNDPCEAGTWSDLHRHEHWGELAFMRSGYMVICTELGNYAAPPQRAVWIPPGLTHEWYIPEPSVDNALYIMPHVLPPGPRFQRYHAMEVSPLVRELIHALAPQPCDYEEPGPVARMVSVLLDQLPLLPEVGFPLPMPRDRRLVALCTALLNEPDSPETIREWCTRLGMSERTLARLFQRGHILQALAQVGLGHVGAVAVLFEHGRYDRIGGALLVQGDDVIRHIVHHMHRAAAGVQHDVIAVQLILMYHFSLHSIVT